MEDEMKSTCNMSSCWHGMACKPAWPCEGGRKGSTHELGESLASPLAAAADPGNHDGQRSRSHHSRPIGGAILLLRLVLGLGARSLHVAVN
jgi:hypothetical protein